MQVEVIWALPTAQHSRSIQVPEGCTVEAAVQLSGLRLAFPEIAQAAVAYGVFGQRIKAPESHVLKAGDRVEIYRSLAMDPKEIRRTRAERVKKEKAAAAKRG